MLFWLFLLCLILPLKLVDCLVFTIICIHYFIPSQLPSSLACFYSSLPFQHHLHHLLIPLLSSLASLTIPSLSGVLIHYIPHLTLLFSSWFQAIHTHLHQHSQTSFVIFSLLSYWFFLLNWGCPFLLGRITFSFVCYFIWIF